jgi:hypothetical protein
MTAKTILISIAIVAVVYPVAMRLLLETAQPMRLKLAALGNELLDEPALSEKQRNLIMGMMDDAWDWRFMLFSLIAAPRFAWRLLVKRSLPNPFHQFSDPVVRSKVEKIAGYFALSTGAANPLAFAVFVFEFLLLAILLRAFRAFGEDSDRMGDAARRLVVRSEVEFKHAV